MKFGKMELEIETKILQINWFTFLHNIFMKKV